MTPEEKIAAAVDEYHAAQAIYEKTLNRAYDRYKLAKKAAYR